MTRRFVILASPLGDAEKQKLREYITQFGAWWHWIDNAWLVTSKDKKIRAENIRDRILDLNPKARIAVFEFPEDIDWATSSSKTADGKTIQGWLESTWAKE